MAKSKIATKSYDVENLSVKFSFSDGRTLTCEIADLTTEVVDRLALHGLIQKVGDSYAGAESIDTAYLAAKGVIDQLVAGLWTSKASKGGIWVEAIARFLDCSLEEALEKWTSKSEEEQKAIKNHPDLKSVKAAIDLEKAQKLQSVDVAPLEL